ncbi:hypothetical protein GNE08_26250 [Trichormus variabilis ARAD]|uniref:hypothetical protein n=1 Tax=Anabaena variabilis TaxID=264691 RepID=UPI00131FC7FB|nr:hypothetical protein [Trichormus variabilis ARAD]MBC1259030.1 hypothetical protein [Trichormus variabilis V5]QHD81632.1 hypothetical protein GSQ19_18480 [Trichormus variabilis 0441]
MPSSESNTCGKQWIDPKKIILKHGTQYRYYVDAAYAANVKVVQGFAEVMQEDLWDWYREPLPVAFLSSEGKIYVGDGHHRVSAAHTVKKQIYVDLRPGELVDAILFSCQSNTDHGYQLRAKDQRKRIEMFLDTLDGLDEVRSRQLLESVPGLSEIERRNCQGGKWSARVVAKYLRLTESGYRTVINIQQEREMVGYFSQFSEGDWVRVQESIADGTDFPWGTIAQIQNLDKRKGVFIIPLPGATDREGRILPSGYIHPRCLEKTEAPQLLDTGKITQPEAITSIEQEVEQQATELGLSNRSQILPDVERNQGEPHSLVDDRPFTGEGDQLSTWINDLPEENFQKVWSAINQRQPEDVSGFVKHLSDEQLWSAIASRSDETLEKLIAWATEILEQRREEMPHAS